MRKMPIIIVAGAPSSVASEIYLARRLKPIGCGPKPPALITREHNSAPSAIFSRCIPIARLWPNQSPTHEAKRGALRTNHNIKFSRERLPRTISQNFDQGLLEKKERDNGNKRL